MKTLEQLKEEAAERRTKILAAKRAEKKAASTLVCEHEDPSKQVFLGQKIRDGKYGEEIIYCHSCSSFH